MAKPKLTLDVIKTRFAAVGWELLEDTYRGSKIKHRARCHCGNITMKEPNVLFGGSINCMVCHKGHQKRCGDVVASTKKEVHKRIGEVLRASRVRQNIAIEYIASELDIAVPGIKNIEAGVVGCSMRTVEEYLSLLDMTLVELLLEVGVYVGKGKK